MKVLVAIDASVSANAIVSDIATRKWSKEISLGVLYVVKSASLASDFVDVESYVNVENEAASELVRNAARVLQQQGITTSAVILKGRPAKTIVDYARQWGAELIIMGSSQSGRLATFFLGSTAKEVLRNAPCSVEIIKTTPAQKPTSTQMKKPAGEMRVLLATDGSPCSLAAAHAVVARAWPPQTQVKVVSVMPASVAAIEPLRGLRFSGVNLTAEGFLVEPVQEALTTAKQVIEDAGLGVAEEMLLGNPKEVIPAHANDWEADLIVVGSHGKRGLERLFEGSVSEAVVLHAPCNVIVVHEPTHP